MRRHPADEAMLDALKAIPMSERVVAHPRDVYGKECALVEVPYNDVVKLAMEMMRKAPIARADAVEMAYDNLLWKGLLKGWERTGEVILLKKLGYARALCCLRKGG